jgi:hypothetical protein
MANAICERVIGTIRRECPDWLIPLSESHLRSILKSWIRHYNIARPHMALGPGVPDPPPINRDFPTLVAASISETQKLERFSGIIYAYRPRPLPHSVQPKAAIRLCGDACDS